MFKNRRTIEKVGDFTISSSDTHILLHDKGFVLLAAAPWRAFPKPKTPPSPESPHHHRAAQFISASKVLVELDKIEHRSPIDYYRPVIIDNKTYIRVEYDSEIGPKYVDIGPFKSVAARDACCYANILESGGVYDIHAARVAAVTDEFLDELTPLRSPTHDPLTWCPQCTEAGVAVNPDGDPDLCEGCQKMSETPSMLLAFETEHALPWGMPRVRLTGPFGSSHGRLTAYDSFSQIVVVDAGPDTPKFKYDLSRSPRFQGRMTESQEPMAQQDEDGKWVKTPGTHLDCRTLPWWTQEREERNK